MTFALVDKMRPELEEQTGCGSCSARSRCRSCRSSPTWTWRASYSICRISHELSKEFAERANTIQQRIFAAAGKQFNIGSPKQLNEFLFGKLGLPTNGLRKTAHGFSVDAEALERAARTPCSREADPDWRGLEKLKSTYVDALPPLGRCRGARAYHVYNQTGAVTGRISSDNPNLQNIPIRTEEGRRVRRAFIARRATICSAWTTARSSCASWPTTARTCLIEAFRQDQDIHRATAALCTAFRSRR